jgi:hypothetical protein
LRHAPDLVGDELRLVRLVGQLAQDDRLALVVVGAQTALDARDVLADDAVGGLDDACGRAIVELEVDLPGVGIILLEVEDIADISLPPAVDRLIGVTDDEEVAVSLGQRRDENVLDAVRVLVLVDEDVLKALLVALQQVRRLLEKVNRLRQQIVEVERVRPAQEPLVLLEDAGDDLLIVRLCQVARLVWRDELALGRGDAPQEAPGLYVIRVVPELRKRGLDDLGLIGGVVDGELRQDAQAVGDDAGVLPQ